MIPLFIDCTKRRVIIFGGGEVAARKAAYFVGEADVVVVSRSFLPAFDDMKITRQDLDLVTASSKNLANLLTGAFLVIGAVSDPVVNNRIGKLCKVMGILFNNADGEQGDVILPATARGRSYTIAISTDGNSPAVAKYIREHIEQTIPELDEMIGLQNRLREYLKIKEPDQKKRSEILRKVMKDPTIWSALSMGRQDVWEDIRARYLHD